MEVLNPSKNYPLEKYFKSWYETFKTDISNITLNSYKATHSKLVTYFNNRAIQDITKREGQQFAKNTNRKMNGFIRTCVKEAIDEGLIKTDFTRNVTITGFASKKVC